MTFYTNWCTSVDIQIGVLLQTYKLMYSRRHEVLFKLMYLRRRTNWFTSVDMTFYTNWCTSVDIQIDKFRRHTNWFTSLDMTFYTNWCTSVDITRIFSLFYSWWKIGSLFLWAQGWKNVKWSMTSKKSISNANQVLVSDVITNWTDSNVNFRHSGKLWRTL